MAHLGAISAVNTLLTRVFQQPKGDLADRLNARVTVFILSVGAGLLLSTHFWGDPINYLLDSSRIPENLVRFCESILLCAWYRLFIIFNQLKLGTYFVPLDCTERERRQIINDKLPCELSYDKDERQKIFIPYYQWIPYILAAQAILFYMPRFFWRLLCNFTGFDLPGTIQFIDLRWHESKNDAAKFRDHETQFELPSSSFIWDGLRVSRRTHGQLSLYYVVYTIVLATNSWIQFLWLNSIIQSPDDQLWGPSVIADLISGKDWEDTGHFPRITHCDFYRRKPSSVQTEAVLCVLNLNIYYEKLLLFLWFWMLFVAVVSTANCISWSLTLCFKQRAQRKIRNFLLDHSHAPYLEKFFKTLGPDGLFILHQISLNVGDLPASYLSLAMLKSMNEHHVASDEYSQMLIQKGAKHV